MNDPIQKISSKPVMLMLVGDHKSHLLISRSFVGQFAEIDEEQEQGYQSRQKRERLWPFTVLITTLADYSALS
jgi:hypothetical protein